MLKALSMTIPAASYTLSVGLVQNIGQVISSIWLLLWRDGQIRKHRSVAQLDMLYISVGDCRKTQTDPISVVAERRTMPDFSHLDAIVNSHLQDCSRQYDFWS
jgi:hypothetical protein